MNQDAISIAATIITVCAVVVAIWQVRTSTSAATRSNALPTISHIFQEWRSPSFRSHYSNALRAAVNSNGPKDFEILPPSYRESAYTVCYFFDYVGTLVAYRIISEELIIGVMGTQLIRIWRAMKPCIDAERRRRAETLPQDTSPGFLAYYEDLVVRIIDRGGSKAATGIQIRLGLRKLAELKTTNLTSGIMRY